MEVIAAKVVPLAATDKICKIPRMKQLEWPPRPPRGGGQPLFSCPSNMCGVHMTVAFMGTCRSFFALLTAGWAYILGPN